MGDLWGIQAKPAVIFWKIGQLNKSLKWSIFLLRWV